MSDPVYIKVPCSPGNPNVATTAGGMSTGNPNRPSVRSLDPAALLTPATNVNKCRSKSLDLSCLGKTHVPGFDLLQNSGSNKDRFPEAVLMDIRCFWPGF